MYSGTSHNPFQDRAHNSRCSYPESFFPIRNNRKKNYPFRPSKTCFLTSFLTFETDDRVAANGGMCRGRKRVGPYVDT